MAGGCDEHVGVSHPGFLELASPRAVGVEHGRGIEPVGEKFAAFLVVFDHRYVEAIALFEDLGQQEAGFASSGNNDVLSRWWLVFEKLTDRVDFSDVADQGDMVSDRKDVRRSGDDASLGIGDHADTDFTGEVEVDQLPPDRLGILNDRDLLDLDLALGEVFQGKQSVGTDGPGEGQGGEFLEAEETRESEVLGDVDRAGVEIGRMLDSRHAPSGSHLPGDARTDDVHLVRIGQGQAEFSRGSPGVEQDGGIAGVAVDGVHIEPVLDLGQRRSGLVDDEDVVVSRTKYSGDRGTDCPGTQDDDIHVGSLGASPDSRATMCSHRGLFRQASSIRRSSSTRPPTIVSSRIRGTSSSVTPP